MIILEWTLRRERVENWTTQPTFTLSILKNLGLWETIHKHEHKVRTTPALSTVILTNNGKDEDFVNTAFDYRQVVRKLLYLEKSTGWT